MEVGGSLSVEAAGLRAAVLSGAEPLEPLLDDGRVLAVVVGVHLGVGRRDVYLIAPGLKGERIVLSISQLLGWW